MVGVALQQRAQHKQLVQRAPLRLGLHGPQQSEHTARIRFRRNTVASVADQLSQPPDHLAEIFACVLGEHRERLRHVIGQPGVGPELHPVGDLVKAHPQPKIGRQQP